MCKVDRVAVAVIHRRIMRLPAAAAAPRRWRSCIASRCWLEPTPVIVSSVRPPSHASTLS
jgi:hypothetical protein